MRPATKPLAVVAHWQQILSAATITAVGLTCNAYLHFGLCSISFRGFSYLIEGLYNISERRNGQGILTGESTPTNNNNSEEP